MIGSTSIDVASLMSKGRDANWNVMALRHDSNIIERYEYDPYGSVRIFAGYDSAEGHEELTVVGDSVVRDATDPSLAYGNPILFAGYFYDNETGLYYVRNRTYSPELGRWLQRDPAGYIDGMNLYQYVRSMPIRNVDLEGLWGIETHWGDHEKRVQGTYDIAQEIGFSDKCARVLADWNQWVDVATPAFLFPYFHFEPGASDIANLRWNIGVYKLRHANVYFSLWLWDVSVYDGLAHIGAALHGYQDAFSHTVEHHADTPWKHVTGPNSGRYGALAKRTRFYRENDSRVHRPDDPDLWPDDHEPTVNMTETKLREIWQIPSVQCYCKEEND